MKLLQEKIEKEGGFQEPDIIKVDTFLNHQLDIKLFNEIGKEFKTRFSDQKIDKILTVEASGIGIAAITAQYFDYIPVIFAKKASIENIIDDKAYESKAFSFTKKFESKIKISKKLLKKGENILILDDFLAQGSASLSLIDLVKQAEANVAGVGIVIEKGFQEGGKILRKNGFNLQSLVIVEKIENGKIFFKE